MADVENNDRCECGHTANAHKDEEIEVIAGGETEWVPVKGRCEVTICRCHQRTYVPSVDQSVRPFTGDNPNS